MSDRPLDSIDSLNLGSLDEKGKPVETRLKDVKSAIAIFSTLRTADEKSAVNRARVDSMFDGASEPGVEPNTARLRVQGPAHWANLTVKNYLCRGSFPT